MSKPVTPELREALVELFVTDLRAKADPVDDPHCVIWLALHASAAITGGLGSFERNGVSSRVCGTAP